MMQATSTTQLSSSKSQRNDQPTNVIVASFAKLARMSAPAQVSSTEPTPQATATISRSRSGLARKGSANQTSPNTAGMRTNASHARSPHSESENHDSWVA